MALKIPDIEADRCIFLVAWGSAKDGPNPQLKRLSKNQKSIDIRVRAGEQRAIVSGYFGSKSGRHFHIDIASKAFFLDNPLPKATHKLADINEVIEKVAGL